MGNRILMKRYVLLMFCFFSFLIVPKQVEAKNPVTMKVEVGWNRAYKSELIPVKVSISSSIPIKGQLRVAEKSNNSQARDVVLPVRQVEVPSGTTKKFQLLIPNSSLFSSLNWEVLLEQEKQILARQTIVGQQLEKNTLMVGVLSDQSDTFSTVNRWLQALHLPHPVSIHPLKVGDMPLVGRALSDFNVLIVSQLSQESLSFAQAKAIQTWVANGGTLLVNGGTYWKSTSEGLEEILPVQFLGKTVEISLPQSLKTYGVLPDKPVIVADSRLKNGSVSLHSEKNHPVIAKKDFFRGNVYFVAYDFAVSPMSQWEGNNQLWKDLQLFTYQSPSSRASLGEDFFYHQQLFKSRLDTSSEQPRPNLFTLFFIFLIYLFLIGPVLFRFLRAKRKLKWAWLGVPICAGLVAIVIMIYGHWVRGNEVIVYSAGYVQSSPTGLAKVRGISTLYSLGKGDYSVRFPQTFAWPSANSQSIEPQQWLMEHQEDTNLVFKQMPQWHSEVIFTESLQSLGGGLEGTLTSQDGKIQVEITNQTRYLIKDIWLLRGDQYLKIGDLKPKESRKVTVPLDPHVEKGKDDFENRILKGNKAAIYRHTQVIHEQNDHSEVRLIGWMYQPIIEMKVVDYPFKQIDVYLIQGHIHTTKPSKGD